MSITSMIGTSLSITMFSGTVLVFLDEYIVPKLEYLTEVLQKAGGA